WFPHRINETAGPAPPARGRLPDQAVARVGRPSAPLHYFPELSIPILPTENVALLAAAPAQRIASDVRHSAGPGVRKARALRPCDRDDRARRLCSNNAQTRVPPAG